MDATITSHELQQLLADHAVTLIDVLLPEDFACRHIPAAGNACVYEMVFLERVAECAPDRDRPVVVYDDSGTTLAARTAKEKLERAGYGRVRILEGGLQAWQASGFAVESSVAAPPLATVRDGVYRVDGEKSVVEWIGRNINNRHHGRITISSGEIVVSKGLPLSGSVVLDMNTITNLDLQDEGWRNMLLSHLKSEDFFDVARYPTASFTLRGAAPIAGSTAGTANLEIAGLLTVRDTTRSLCFAAMVVPQADGTLKAQAALDLDRTLWDVSYGSGKLYERLGMHLVNDLISIELFIVAREAV
ncbi:MAG: YceI family protein [Geobacteraceae bacterium]|nr:YceI family protein [Geobacteraceae bacterium]